MSASTERKNRQAAREAGTDKKMLAQEKEAQEKAKSKRRWTIGTAAVVILIALVLLLSSPLMYKLTAYSVGSRNYSAAETGYYYANQYYTFANNYGSYASLFGLDTSNGIRGLDKQECGFAEGSWKDYFLNAAKSQMLQNTALNDYAKANGITLDEGEIAAVDASFEGIDEAAKSYGYGSADKMMAANYGGGVSVKLVRDVYLENALASKALEAAADSFTYSDEKLEETYAAYDGSKDSFSYSYVTVEAHDHDAGAEGSEEEHADADQTTLSGENLYIAADWMKDASRKAGDITVEESGDHIYVVVFLGRDDNHYKTVSVRHILVKAEADANGNYSDEAKAAAKAKAEQILAEFNAGDKSEDSFAALANQYSEDAGSNTRGGLYEGIYKGQMVKEFNDFCFAPHSKGDTAIVYGESSSYAGYHVMYFVGEGELYAYAIAKDELKDSDLETWLDELTAPYVTSEGFGMKFVG